MAGETPIIGAMAQRYATALFELAAEADSLDKVAGDLERFDTLLAESADLMRLVRSPVLTAAQQSGALAALIDRSGIGGVVARFLMLLTANRRLFAVREIIRAFRALLAQHKGQATAIVTVAEPLTEAHRGEIASALYAVTGKDVKLEVKIDPAILGGLVVKLGSRMVDSSLRTRLNALRQAMKEVG